MIQRRVKWRKGVTVENGSTKAAKGLGKSREAGGGCVCVCLEWVRVWDAAIYFKAWRGKVA